MGEIRRKGYGRCHLLEICFSATGRVSSAVHNKKKPETTDQSTVTKPIVQQSINDKEIGTPSYEIVEGWVLPCHT